MKALVVDDSGIMRKIVSNALVAMNFAAENIAHAADGVEALQAVEADTFSIILMDWNMPNMLGIDAVKAIREKGITTPIMMVTTEGERSNVIAAIQAGANNYLVKPFTTDDLQQKVAQMIPELVHP